MIPKITQEQVERIYTGEHLEHCTGYNDCECFGMYVGYDELFKLQNNDALDKIVNTLRHYTTAGAYIALHDIVNAPAGDEQFSDVPGVESEWVDQTNNDPAAGCLYIELTQGRWAKFEYCE